MGEVVVSSEGGRRIEDVDMEIDDQSRGKSEKKGVGGGGDGGSTSAASSRVVMWERFLPNMVLRVLLVEADDSTRQTITALLRKCSYRVAAVSDGLKAWEVLRERSHNIDLILTEVDFPSISGFALLTLIREHEICKNIPVIMMSSQDSVSTVYKCMLRGAADFLVKPVRKNELGNLWQHVWRRQTSSGGAHGTPDVSVVQPKVEATAENNARSNQSSGNIVCVQRNRERIEKGSEAQSSCTKPEMDAEETDVEITHELTQPKGIKCVSSDKNVKQHEVSSASKDSHMQEGHSVDIEIGSQVATRVDCENSGREEGNADDHWQQMNFVSETPDSLACASPSREAIDLIGAFNNYLKCSHRSPAPNIGANKIDSSPQLDLSLRRYNPCGSVNQGADERTRLNRSDASAFSREVNLKIEDKMIGIEVVGQQCQNFMNPKIENHPSLFQKQYEGEGMNLISYTDSTAVRDVNFTSEESNFFSTQRRRQKGDLLMHGPMIVLLRPPIMYLQSHHQEVIFRLLLSHSPWLWLLLMSRMGKCRKFKKGVVIIRTKRNNYSWVPFASDGGPLAEVLHTGGATNPASPYAGKGEQVSPVSTNISSPSGVQHRSLFN